MIKFLSSTTYVPIIVSVILTVRITNADQNTFDLDLATSIKKIIGSLLQNQDLQSEQNSILGNAENVEKPTIDKYSNSENELAEYSEETIILSDSHSSQAIIRSLNESAYLNTLKSDNPLAKYKHMRHKIGSLLKKAQIADNTKDFITTSFDKMISKIDGCKWNKMSKELARNTGHRFGKTQEADRMALLKSWRLQFNNLINRYSKQHEKGGVPKKKENFKFLSSLREFFFEMHNDFRNLIAQYDLKCNFVDDKNIGRTQKTFRIVNNTNNNNVTSDEDVARQKSRPDICESYIICAKELEEFSQDFYKDLQETIEQVFNGYLNLSLAESSKASNSDKGLFADVFKSIKRHMKKKFNNTFSEEFHKMDFDLDSNLKIILEDVVKFIIETVTQIKALIDDVLTEKVKALPYDIRFDVKKDIMTDIDIELGNVQETFKGKICSAFQSCDGKYVRRMDNSTKLAYFRSI